jgi:hypothetical protein
MAATLTILLDDEVFRKLRTKRSVAVAIRPLEVRRDAVGGDEDRTPSGRRRTPIGPGAFGYRRGSLPDRLLGWGKDLRRPFGFRDLIVALGVNRSHAQRLLTRVLQSGHVKRVQRGLYRVR